MKIHTIKKMDVANCYVVSIESDNKVLASLFFDSVALANEYDNLVQADLFRNGEYIGAVFDDIATELVELATNEGILK